MTSPRPIVSGATTAITRRTAFRKAFLGPWDPMVAQVWLYALADAQHHTDVAIHHGCLTDRPPHRSERTNLTPLCWTPIPMYPRQLAFDM
jgi:hypothetical protein